MGSTFLQSAVGHTVAVMSDGTVKAWGWNNHGQLGDNTTTDKHTPTTISSLSNVQQLMAEEYDSFALMSDSTVKGWGRNDNGELGMGDTNERNSPTTISGLSGVRQVCTGGCESYSPFAAMNDGTVYAWGLNSSGELGLGDTTNRNVPCTISWLSMGTYVSITAPTSGQVFAEQSVPSTTPQISVCDPYNSTVTCKYYVDLETTPRDTQTVTNATTTQTVSFASCSITALTTGGHSITFETNNGYTDKTWSVSFTVDKAPVLGTVTTSSTTNSITVSWSATDDVGLNATPYRYTIGSTVSGWTTNTASTVSGLSPTSPYNIVFEAKDSAGQVSSYTATVNTKPAAPTIQLSTVSSTSLGVTIVDTTNAASTQYQIQTGLKYVNASGVLVDVPQWLSTKTITVTGLSPNTLYSFQARAQFAGGQSDLSTVATATTKVDIPSGITSTFTDTTDTLTWNPVAAADSYDIQADGTVVGNVTTTQFTQSSLTPGSSHTYKVRAVNNTTGTGDWSNGLTNVILASKPTGLTASASNGTVVHVSWTAAAGAVTYDLLADGTVINGISATSYDHTVADSSTKHTYQVRAVNTAGSSDWTDVYTKLALPGVPQNVAAFAGCTAIKLVWDAVDGAASYTVEVDSPPISSITTPYYIHTGLTQSTQHTYRVKATNASGTSSYCSLVTQTTKTAQTINYNASISNGVNFNYTMKASNVQDFSVYHFTVTYSTSDLDVVDLCAATTHLDTTTGDVPGSCVSITAFTPGSISFTVNKPGVSGKAWVGIIDRILFHPKTTGSSTITYTIQ